MEKENRKRKSNFTMNIKTEEAKLREEIEKIEKNYQGWKEEGYPCIEDYVCEHSDYNDEYLELEAKLQQLLADKKMFKDAIEKLEKREVKFVDKTCKRLTLKELLKTLGLGEK